MTRLMADAGIVRNLRKIEATITNARATQALRATGGLVDLVWSFRPAVTPAPASYDEVPTTSPESKALAKALRAQGFAFVGPTTMFALMEAVGIVDTHLLGSHRRGRGLIHEPGGAARARRDRRRPGDLWTRSGWSRSCGPRRGLGAPRSCKAALDSIERVDPRLSNAVAHSGSTTGPAPRPRDPRGGWFAGVPTVLQGQR